jgi:hypothetical protein
MIHNVLIRTANCNVFRNPSKTDILVMTDSPDTQIKDGATNLQCQDLVENNTSNYVHCLDKKSVRSQRPLLLLVSWAEPSLSAS